MSNESIHRLNIKWKLAIWLPCLAAVVSVFIPSELPPLVDQSERPGLLFSTYLRHHGIEPVAFGKSLLTDFVFVNTSKNVVQIQDVERSCSCMTPRLSSRIIQPGEQGVLQVPIATINESPGMHEYLLNVSYTDPKPRTASLRIKAVMPEQSVVVAPRAMMMSQKTAKTFPLTPVTISDYRDNPLKVTSVFSTVDFVRVRTDGNDQNIRQVSHQPEISADGRTVIGGSVAGNIPPGKHHALIVAETTDAQHPALVVPIIFNGPDYKTNEQPEISPQQIRFLASTARSKAQSTMIDIIVPSTWNIDSTDCWPEQIDLRYTDPKKIANEQKMVIQLKVNLTDLPPVNVQHGLIQMSFNDGKNLVTAKVNFIWP